MKATHPLAPQRQTNFELLRILAMFLIVSFHLSFKSGFSFDEPSADTLLVKTLWLLGELGVNLFMLVTGYFLVQSRGAKSHKFILLLAQILFYYFTTSLIVSFIQGVTLGGKRDLLLLFFPTILGKYWYATAYVILYILSPWINSLIRSLSQSSFLKLICTLLILYSLIPTFFGVVTGNPEGLLFYTRLLWLFVIYLCGAYFHLYRFALFSNAAKPAALFAISFASMVLGILAISFNQNLFARIGTTEWAYFWPPNTLPMFLASIGLFGVFLNLKIPRNRLINKIASTTFGIYLIHDGPLQATIWHDIINASAYQMSPWLPAYILISALLVFLSCSIIDLGRQWLERMTLGNVFASRAWARFSAVTTRTINAILDKLIDVGSSENTSR